MTDKERVERFRQTHAVYMTIPTSEALASEFAKVRSERDAAWCAALLPEGTRVIQSATTRVNDPAFVAEVEDFRRGVRP